MNNLKNWLTELAIDTIIAAVIALLFYTIRLDRTWNDVSQTFFTAFIVVFILGLWQRFRKNKPKQ